MEIIDFWNTLISLGIGVFLFFAIKYQNQDIIEKDLYDKIYDFIKSAKDISEDEKIRIVLKRDNLQNEFLGIKVNNRLIRDLKKYINKAGPDKTPLFFLSIIGLSILITFCFFRYIIGDKFDTSVLKGVVLGIFLGFEVFKFFINSYVNKFLKAFPEGLDTILRAVKSGMPITQAIGVAARKSKYPVANIFLDIDNKLKIGLPLVNVLRDVIERVEVSDFKYFAAVLIIQQENGGPLSEVFFNLVDTIKSRMILDLKISAMTSEGKMAAVLIGGLPFFLSLLIYFISPQYISVIFYEGKWLLNIAIYLLLLGIFTIWKMISVRSF